MPPKKSRKKIEVPPIHDWRTSDADEINKRRLRAREEKFRIHNIDDAHPVFSNFEVNSASGLCYRVEIRGLDPNAFSCSCVDFRINQLGTCKHVEAVLLLLKARFRKLFNAARASGSDRIDIVPDTATETLRAIFSPGAGPLPRPLLAWFKPDGGALDKATPEETFEALAKLAARIPALRLSQEIEPWIIRRRRAAESRELRRAYELKVQSGEWPLQETTVPLFPYQREGMLHLAFTERALLADEMGLGKTIQAIAACALLRRLGNARRVLVVTPASLKSEWEEQIARFTGLPYQLVYGNRRQRLAAYVAAGPQAQASAAQPGAAPCFFTIVNYEQMIADALDVNEHLRPDVVILDEAQRIKNWNTKTAQAVKRLRSRYAFVLTGTPIENRIDELHSLMDFLNPSVLGPLFAFNRAFYDLDDKGRPVGYRNLDSLHAQVAPFMLRRRKSEVETELPERTDRNHFVPMSPAQADNYAGHEQEVLRLASIAERRPLTQQQQEKLQRELAMMRMTCDTNYILDREDRTCPKLAELEKLLDECRENDLKVIVFSEWERMLELARGLCEEMGIGYAWHTGSVPQKHRRAEINAFKEDPACRVFLSTDSGSTGLNLQAASVVVNCDLPWNPAKLEQRIARAWRKNQTRPVTVVNLISENTIEHRMLATLATKQTVAASVLDSPGKVTAIKIRGVQKAFLAQLQQLATTTPRVPTPENRPGLRLLSSDPVRAFAERAREQFGAALVRCEERFPESGDSSVLFVVVERDALLWRAKAQALHRGLFGEGKTEILPSLEVIDRATDEALNRLIATGLISGMTRAVRPLYSTESGIDAPAPLSAEELARLQEHGAKAAHALRIGEVLAAAGFESEARGHLLDALLQFARAFAVRSRYPEPAQAEDALVPPLSSSWGEALPSLRDYVANPSLPSTRIMEALVALKVETGPSVA